jgi:hypothetical protein
MRLVPASHLPFSHSEATVGARVRQRILAFQTYEKAVAMDASQEGVLGVKQCLSALYSLLMFFTKRLANSLQSTAPLKSVSAILNRESTVNHERVDVCVYEM